MKLLISLTRRLIDSIVGYGKEVISYFESAEMPELLTAKPFTKVKESYTRMVQGYMKARKNAYTELLFSLDALRDSAYKILQTVVEGLVYSEVPAEAAAAQLLKRLFDQYGNDFLIYSYVKETAQMSKFIQELKKPEYAAAIATLKQEPKMVKLEDAEKKFEETYTLSVEDKAAHAAYESASAARKEFEEDMRKMMNYVELMAMNGDPKWLALCQKIEAFNIKFEQNEAKRAATAPKKATRKAASKDTNKDDAPQA
jgi:hypothetical protein